MLEAGLESTDLRPIFYRMICLKPMVRYHLISTIYNYVLSHHNDGVGVCLGVFTRPGSASWLSPIFKSL